MDGLTEVALCKVCNHYIKYQPTDVFVDGDEFFVYCDHCMNVIKVGEEKFINKKRLII